MTQSSTDRCHQLRKLHSSLVNEINTLKAIREEQENEGVENPVETTNILKHLQETLLSIDLELQKCPPA